VIEPVNPALAHGYWDMTTYRSQTAAVGRYHASPNPLDLDYRLFRTAGGEELLALVADEAEPSVVLRRFKGGGTDLLTTWD
jgi:hypothetical protein